MREEAVKELLAKAKAEWSVIQRLIDEHLIKEIEYQGKKFYLRRLKTDYR